MQINEMAIRETLRLAKQSQGGPFGAVVVRDNTIIGRGTNCVIPYGDPTAHAEILAIRDACSWLGSFDLSGCHLYASCYPCPMCLAACAWANISHVYYAAPAVAAAAVGFRDLALDRPPCIHLPKYRKAAVDFMEHWGGALY